MSSPPLPLKNLRPCDGVVVVEGPGQGQVLGMELSLMEMTAVEYSHVQDLLQPQPDAVTDSEPPAASTALSPLLAAQAIDLSTTSDDHIQAMFGEKTPASHGEVPNFVFAKIKGIESPLSPPEGSRASVERRATSSAKVCLEKRFNSLLADSTRQQDPPPALLSNVLTIVQQSVEPQEAVLHQEKRWMKSDLLGISAPFVRAVYDPVTNIYGQVFAHVVEPNKHQSLIIPKNFNPERVVAKIHYTSTINATDGAKVAPDSAGQSRANVKRKTRSCMPISQRRELHNIKERERRRKIRQCCDELNTMVPFCNSDTDKVTTLQWTAAFVSYINQTYGESFKEEFVDFAHKKGLVFKSSSSSNPAPILEKMDDTQDVPLEVEQ